MTSHRIVFLSVNWAEISGTADRHNEADSVDASAGTSASANASASAGVSVDVIGGEGEYWLRPYKDFDLPVPSITVTIEPESDGRVLILDTDAPAFFVTIELGGRKVWSDNGFTLLPNRPKRLQLLKTLTNDTIPDVPEYRIEHL